MRHPSRPRLLIATLLPLFAATCGDDPVEAPNRAPVASAKIPDATVAVGDSVTLDLTPYFSDPDGDTLVFKAVSSDASVAAVSVSGSTITTRGVAKGAATVTVTATDPEGLSASQDFEVTVPNRQPKVADTIPGQQLFRGDSAMIGVGPYFSDPDDDPLTFDATSSDASVAIVSVSGNTVTVLAVASGGTTATVTAADPEGLAVSQEFEIMVPNRSPVVSDSIGDQELFRGDSARLGLMVYFADPDDDSLGFVVVSSDSAVAILSVSGATVTIQAMRQGTAIATVTASDPGGLTVSQTFEVKVPNRPPQISDSIAAQELFRRDSVTLGMTAYFADPDGDSLAFTPTSSDPSVAHVSASGSSVKVSAVGVGTASVTVIAADPGGLSVSQTFEVTVRSADRDLLEVLYRSMNGDAWVNKSNWLTDKPLHEWHGVRTDPNWRSGHRVIALVLRGNNLTGPIPPEIGGLDSLKHLDLAHNPLNSPIPPELGRLGKLQWLFLESSRLTGKIPPEIGDLESLTYLELGSNPLIGEIPPELGNISSLEVLRLYDNSLTGSIPPELGNLSNLKQASFYRTELSGPIPPEIGDLASLEHLLIGINDISGPIPPEIGNLTNLRTLTITLAGITGPLPPELGNLASLEHLSLAANPIGGPIPPELGKLTSLKTLLIHFSQLTGEIPPELGNLASLEEMWGYSNNFTGPLPPELGNLANLKQLRLFENSLSGPIPATFGNLSKLQIVLLADNGLTGNLPPGLGGLADLEVLELANNDLGGPVPPEFKGLARLRELALTGNSNMGSPLPADLTALEDLRILLAGETGLCAPRTRDFRAWLRRLYRARIASCGEKSAAYLTQAVQSREFPVPLIAGERALLRVFLTADEKNDEDLPGVTVRLYEGDGEIHSKYIAGKPGPIPMMVDEGDLEKSVNAEIPGKVIREDLEMVIEVDSVDASLGVPRRIPEEGRMAVEVDSMPVVEMTAIPFLWTSDPDSSIIDIVSAISKKPMEHELLKDTRTLLPVAGVDVAAHAPVESSTNNAIRLLFQTQAIRVMEGSTGYYMGTMAGPVTAAAGVAFVPGRSSFSVPHSSTIAHELGHNMSLYHAPCGGAAGTDPAYPDPNGRIGAWGWNSETETLVSPETPDLMSYCGPKWISDYHFTNAARFRLSDEDTDELPGPPPPSLLLWGGVNADGTPFLEPAFVVTAPASLPDSVGDYRIEGLGADSTELFSLTFGMLEVADAEGASGFTFVLPAVPGWDDALASIRLSGPAGSATLDLETERPMAILRDRTTGQVRAFLDRLPADTSGFEVHFSRGIPDPGAWR